MMMLSGLAACTRPSSASVAEGRATMASLIQGLLPIHVSRCNGLHPRAARKYENMSIEQARLMHAKAAGHVIFAWLS